MLKKNSEEKNRKQKTEDRRLKTGNGKSYLTLSNPKPTPNQKQGTRNREPIHFFGKEFEPSK